MGASGGGFVFWILPAIFIHHWGWSPVRGGGGSMDVRSVSSLASSPLILSGAQLVPHSPQPSVLAGTSHPDTPRL